MRFERLRIQGLRCLTDVAVELGEGIHVFVGPNGYGKTNLVEALWYSSTLGSHRVGADAPLAMANPHHLIAGQLDRALPVVDEHEIIPGTVHLCELH